MVPLTVKKSQNHNNLKNAGVLRLKKRSFILHKMLTWFCTVLSLKAKP